MGKSSSPPPPPDPQETSAAQTGTNVGTAIANANLQMVDQYTPYGSLTYSQKRTEGGSAPRIQKIPGSGGMTMPVGGNAGNVGDEALFAGFNAGQGAGATGARFRVGDETFGSRKEARKYRKGLMEGGVPETYTYTDPYTGKTYEIPRYESRVELSPAQQEMLDANQGAQINLASLAEERSDFLRGYLPDTEATTDEIDNKLFDLGRKRLDPMFDRRDEDLRTRLANQGIKAGSEAYDRELGNLGEQENDAYNQLLLQGRGTALNEVNMPINQITALLSGSQVQNPNVQPQTPGAIPTTDNASIINNNYQQQMNAWQQEQAAKGSMMSGLGGLFQAGLSLSDERAKTDKKKVGETKDGMGLYSFKYKGSPRTEVGLMAQEVKKKRPSAVKTGADGLMRVDYEKALGA